MVFEVKIYKPNKNGKLDYHKKLSQQEVSTIHWNKFNRDNKYALKYSDTPKYHRIGNALKKCVEPDCNQLVQDPRYITCSKACKTNRNRRKRQKLKKDTT